MESHAQKNINDVLVDDGSSENPNARGSYLKNSRTTKWRRINEFKKVDPRSTLHNYFSVVEKTVEEEPLTRAQQELKNIEEHLEKLKEITAPVMNSRDDGSLVKSYQFSRLLSVQSYFERRLEGQNKGTASLAAAKFLWPRNSAPSRARNIVAWSKEFMEFGDVSEHSQGVHVKRESCLSHNDVKTAVLEMVRKTEPAERSLVRMLKVINDEIIPSVIGVPGTISPPTLSKYLHEWGFSYRKNRKTIFFDGHEREDVVEYRRGWSKRMMEYMSRSEFYEENQVDVIEPSLVDGQKKVVFVTHDESTFYANDGSNDLWLESGENYMRKKGMGQSIMISEFQCPCHGTMRSSAWMSRRLFKAGTDREGWWTSENMVKQLEEDAIPLFELLHPGCVAVFLFDNSSNHGAYAKDALVASRMTLNEKPWPLTEKYQFKDTMVQLSNGETLQQTFFFDKTVISTDRRGRQNTKVLRYFKGKFNVAR